jgi:pimeloyl-ACP methyl ester carboxylesterase
MKSTAKTGMILWLLLMTIGISLGCAAGEESMFDSNGMLLYYREVGKGEPVILVHGLGANEWLNWRVTGVTTRLSKHFRVISFDSRGHGRSMISHQPADYGNEMVEDVIRLMDHLGIKKAHVVGYSMGGFVALKLLETHPDRLLSATACASGWEKPEGASMLTLEAVRAALAKNRDISPLMRSLGLDKTFLGPLKVAVVNAYMRFFADPQVFVAILTSFPELVISEETLRNNKVPLCSIVGSRDPMRKGAEAMRGVADNLEWHVIPGATHFSMCIRPSCRDVIEKFLLAHSG